MCNIINAFLVLVSSGRVQCEECDGWILKSNYAVHQRRHRNQRPFKCEVAECNEAFCARGDLEKHVSSVHDKLRYKCQQCEKSCGTESGLSRHVRSVHEKQKNHCCPHCSFKCFCNADLRKHCSSWHPFEAQPAMIRRWLLYNSPSVAFDSFVIIIVFEYFQPM